MKLCSSLLVVPLVVACATVKPAPPEARPAARTALTADAQSPLPVVPPVPHLFKSCALPWVGSLIGGGVISGAACLAGPCADKFNPDPAGAEPQWIRNTKGAGLLSVMVLTPIVLGMIGAVTQCKDDQAQPSAP